MLFKKFSDIEQFRHVVQEIKHKTQCIGIDNAGDPMYDSSRVLPTLQAIATTKIHGTNCGIGFDYNTGEIWAQSRTTIITPEKDNAGFAKFVLENKNVFKNLFNEVAQEMGCGPNNKLYIFGEWCGKGIQKGVAVNELEKRFVIFDYCVEEPLFASTATTHFDFKFSSATRHFLAEHNTYDIKDFGVVSVTIDFNEPGPAIKRMNELMEAVETECPVGKAFGVSGVGEGLVFKVKYEGKTFRWKVKGEKHSKKKPAQEKKPENPLLAECVEKISHGWRFEQGMTELFGQNYNPLDVDVKRIGEYFKWIQQDTVKEEHDIIQEYVEKGLEQKQIMQKVQELSKQFFFSEMNPQ